MFKPIQRAWRRRQARSRFSASVWNIPPGLFLSADLLDLSLATVEKAGGPLLDPYESLARVWNEYATHSPDYIGYLAFLTSQREVPCRAVLDLACGTGHQTRRIADHFGEAVGLDASDQMLDIARQKNAECLGIQFVRGDFRNFALDRRFDAAICAFNSLNYLSASEELALVFSAVARHLRPGGVFMFDVTTEPMMRYLSGMYMHALTGEKSFAIRFDYNRTERKETSRVILRDGLELHCRIPIGMADVNAALGGTGLEFREVFSIPRMLWGKKYSLVFVLAKR